jgi:hypothetical protein
LVSLERPLRRKGYLVRYEPDTFERHQLVDETAVAWLASPTVALLPLSDLEPTRATPAAPDVPASVGGMIAASYGALIVALYVATAGSLSSIFAIAIAALFVATFFTIPRIFFAVEPMTENRPGLGKFIKRGMETLTGHSSGPAALVQMLVVPVFLTLAVLAMGLIVALA